MRSGSPVVARRAGITPIGQSILFTIRLVDASESRLLDRVRTSCTVKRTRTAHDAHEAIIAFVACVFVERLMRDHERHLSAPNFAAFH